MANLSFDISVSEIFDTLSSGGRLVLTPAGEHWDSGALIDLVIRHHITHLQAVPAVLRMLIEDERFRDCDSLRHVICGGETLPEDLALRFSGRSKATLHNLYGPSETCVDTTHLVFQPSASRIPGKSPSFGEVARYRWGDRSPTPKFHILDPYLQPAPAGVLGEIYIGGAGLGLGYLNDPVRTAESFIPNPFGEPGERLYRSGDLARYSWEGEIHFCGRIDDQVKLRGYRIELGEIEQALRAHPQVKQAAVVMLQPDATASGGAGESLVAYIVAEQSGRLATQELRSHLKRKLPEYMLPAAFIQRDSLPLLPNGKIDRLALATLKPSERRGKGNYPRAHSARTGFGRDMAGDFGGRAGWIAR